MISGLTSLLANRKKFIDEVSEIGQGVGFGHDQSTLSSASFSKFNGNTFLPKSETGFLGLSNQGATCYLNSLLQSLFCCVEFRAALFEFEYQAHLHGTEEFCVTRQLQKLFGWLQLSDRGVMSTMELTKAFGWSSADSFTQQDVQECMSIIFNCIASIPPATSSASGNDGNSKENRDSLASFFATKWEGLQYDGLQCQNCLVSRGNSIAFRDLQVQVKGQLTLENALRTYVEKEAMDGIICEHCEGQRFPHAKGFQLLKLPYILSIQLKRFDLDWNTMQRIKINDELVFPLELNMSPYLEKRVENGVDDDSVYDLLSVLIHSGSPFAGHYYCYVRDFSNPDDQNNWLCFNDSNVTKLSPQEIVSCLGFGVCDEVVSDSHDAASSSTVKSTSATSKYANASHNAYMLLYRKRSTDNINSLPSESIPLELRRLVEQDNEKYRVLKTEYEYEKSFLHLNVLHSHLLLNVRIHESASVRELVDMVHAAIVEQAEKQAARIRSQANDSSSSTSGTNEKQLSALLRTPHIKTMDTIVVPNRDCMRLRMFDSIRGVLLGVLGQGDDSMQLSALSKADVSRQLHVEVCSSPSEASAHSTDDECLPCLLVIFSLPASDQSDVISGPTFSTPQPLLIPVAMSLQNVLELVMQQLAANPSSGIDGLVASTCVLCTLDESSGLATRLRPNPNVNISTVLRAGASLYVDIADPNSSDTSDVDGVVNIDSEPRLLKYFNDFRNRVTVSVKYLLVPPDTPFNKEDNYFVASQDVIIDQRRPLCSLVDSIVSWLPGATRSSISLHKLGNRLGSENGNLAEAGISGDLYEALAGAAWKDLDASLLQCGITDGSAVQVLHRAPLQKNQFRLQIFTPNRDVEIEPISESSTSDSAEESSNPLQLVYIGEIVVAGDALISDVKLIVARLLVDSIELSSKIPDFSSILSSQNESNISEIAAKLPLRLRAGTLKPDVAELPLVLRDKIPYRMNAVLRDQATVAQALLPIVLADNLSLVVQYGPECIGMFTENHILLTLQEWNCVENKLRAPVEVALLKSTSYGELQAIARAYEALDGSKKPSVNIPVEGSTNSVEPRYLFAKPFAWQLKEASTNVPSLKWSLQPKLHDTLTAAPWRLVDGSIVLFVIEELFRQQYSRQEQAPVVSAPIVRAAETGFRIYSREEQVQRNAEEKEAADQRKSLVASKLEALAGLRRNT